MLFTSRIFTLALEITFLLNKYFFLKVSYKFLSQSSKRGRGGPNKIRGVGKFLKKKGGRLLGTRE